MLVQEMMLRAYEIQIYVTCLPTPWIEDIGILIVIRIKMN